VQVMASGIFKGDGLLSLILLPYETACAETVLEDVLMRTHDAKLISFNLFSFRSRGIR
jgi:hypothetical protein